VRGDLASQALSSSKDMQQQQASKQAAYKNPKQESMVRDTPPNWLSTISFVTYHNSDLWVNIFKLKAQKSQ